MILIYTHKKSFILAFVLLFLVTSLTPVSAGFFPFKSKQGTSPEQHLQNKDQIDAYNAQAIRLFEEGLFEEAQDLWERAIQLMEYPVEYPEQSQELPEIQEREFADEELILLKDIDGFGVNDVDELYEMAVSLFKKQKYVAAKKIFDRIEAIIPDYKASRNYITILRHKIKQTQQILSGDKFKEGVLARQKEREEWAHILEESGRQLREKLVKQVAPLYEEALQQYQTREFKLAKDYFTEVDRILPGYKDVAKYLARIDIDIREEGKRLVEEKRKKEILARKKEKEEWQRVLQESKQELQKKLEEQAEPIYQQAIEYYKQRQFELAKTHFQEVEGVIAGYKSTVRYLEHIDQDIKEEVLLREQQRARELEWQKREEELVKKREEDRLQRGREAKERERLEKFQAEMASRHKEREQWLNVLEESERDRQNKLEEQAKFVYMEAVRLYKKKQFEEAREGFLEAQQIFPDYKSTVKYLTRIDQKMEEEENRRIAKEQKEFQEQKKEKQLTESRQREGDQRLRLIEEQKRLQEFKKEALARKKQREEWEHVLQENERERQRKLEEEVEHVYREALNYYKAKQWEQARDGFLGVEDIVSDYKSTRKYLAGIDKSLHKGEQQQREIAKKVAELQKQEESLARRHEDEYQRKLRETENQNQIQQQKEHAEAAYKFALSLYKRKNYVQAKDKFLEVEQALPGYKATGKYLKRVDGDIAKAQERRQREQQLAFERQVREQRLALKREEDRIGRLKKEEEKVRLQRLKEEVLARQQDREEWEGTIEQIGKDHQDRLRQQAESIYQEALRYYKAGWFEQAKNVFEEVEAAVPGYKSTKKYLARIDKDIVRENRLRRESENKIREYQKSDKQVAKKHKKKRVVAKKQEERVEKRKQGFSRADGNTDEVVKEATKERQREFSRETESKYREALDLYRAKEFIGAKLKFIEVESLSPGYKATLDYLGRIDKDISQSQQTASGDAQQDFRNEIEKITHQQKHLGRKEQEELKVEARLTKIEGQQKSEIVQQTLFQKSEGDGRGNRTNRVGDRRKELKSQRRAVQQEYEEQFKQLYAKAVKLYRSGSYEEAKGLFLQIEQMKPGYKRASSYLKKTEAKIRKGLQKPSSNVVLQPPGTKTRNDVINEALNALEQRL